ncbi:hypothetical protein SDRG_15916 [Saprolegnia diclina VS20]|uniref:25S rRNA (uridine-N(3))-methyltransferase BMT5-like domain-containing protein n=1 Tax=Saprolegnia diclina (strain VS20) TaxID=1156394 RepID=T0PYU6_SAPDV|nr:hypothetical protein SDRG_15916 [Saprolegnia diclina VS20]EQC26255.1 hypothetical protein SDRG_15916 [Saprolegnia diclina VS20]|eukprot:XP_008620324.1 hypothetical protein SDRG_15916 [Saprolegnia diclina VS20]
MGKRKHGAAFDARAVKQLKGKKMDKRSKTQAAVQLYTPADRILVLGDGDFSFSKGLVAHRGGSGTNLVATSYDSTSEVRKKYPNAAACIQSITQAKAHVMHGVDATKLSKLPHSDAVPALFDYIIFNFPHSGEQRVHINRALLLDFFESARPKLALRGEAHVTLKTKPPYSNWLVEDQARANGFVVKERRPFRMQLFPGYNHRTTEPDAKKFEPDQCVTYVFIVDRSRFPVVTDLPPKTTSINDASKQVATANKTPVPKAKVEEPKAVEKPKAVAKLAGTPRPIKVPRVASSARELPSSVQADIRALILAKLAEKTEST